MLEHEKLKNSVRKKGVLAKLHKMQFRIQTKIKNGSFALLTRKKQRQLINRLRRYTLQLKRLGLGIKTSAAIGVLSLAMSFLNPATAQFTYVEQTGTSNPLDQFNQNSFVDLDFVDIDGDGDQDVFLGIYDPITEVGKIKYLRNEGSQASPIFVEQTGINNPLESATFAYVAFPEFVDIDGDGDHDLFVGEYGGNLRYFKNEGSDTEPSFEEQTGANNPLALVTGLYISTPNLADVDGDGDFDAFVGEYYGGVKYYKNEGSETEPSFVLQSGMNNPLDAVDVNFLASPDLIDVDSDGDLDACIGSEAGTITYYLNNGDDMNPDFELQLDKDNPFESVSVGTYSFPALVDIDDDGDPDAFVGSYEGAIAYFKNSPLATIPQPNNVCIDAGIQSNLGGAEPIGGIYAGPGIIDDNNGMTYQFDPAIAEVGLHQITYTIDGQEVSTNIEVYDLPLVSIDLPDTLFIENGMLPGGIDGGGTPLGGTYSTANNEIDDDNNGMSFSFNANAVAGATYTISYSYIDINGCENIASLDVVLEEEVVGINFLDAKSLNIYPNPTSGILELKGSIPEEITVMDIQGRILKRELNPDSRIDLTDLPVGFYFLKVIIEDKIYSTKIIKE